VFISGFSQLFAVGCGGADLESLNDQSLTTDVKVQADLIQKPENQEDSWLLGF
jgi:hypothetical protein